VLALFAALLRARALSCALTILALSMALTFLGASIGLYQMLSRGQPVGTYYSGRSATVFAYMSSIGDNFFLSPRQMIELQTTAGADTTLIACTGARSGKLELAVQPLEISLDIISEQFFDALKVKTTLRPHAPDAPHAWISTALIERAFNGVVPDSILIDGRRYSVAGTVTGFRGLFDSSTDVWVPWQFGQAIFAPGLEDKGVLSQPEMYNVVALSALAPEQFAQMLARLRERIDILMPMWDGLHTVEGISRSESKRLNADRSMQLYLWAGGLMLLTALLNLACWIALTRAQQVRNTQILLRIGVGQLRLVLFNLALAALPIALALLIAYLCVPLMQDWLYAMPTMREFAENAPQFQAQVFGASAYSTGLALVVMIGLAMALSEAIAYISGSGYQSTGNNAASPTRVLMAFRTLIAVMAGLCAVGTLIAVSISNDTIRVRSLLASSLTNSTWLLPLVNTPAISELADQNDSNEAVPLSRIQGAIQMPQVQNIALTSAIPMLTFGQRETLTLNEGDPNGMDVRPVSGSAKQFETMRYSMRVGRSVNRRGELVLNTEAEKKLLELSGQQVLGQTLYTNTQDPMRVVGVVQSAAYSANPDAPEAVVFMHAQDRSVPLTIIALSGQLQANDMREVKQQLTAAGIATEEPKQISSLAGQAFGAALSKLALTLYAGLGTALIALMSLVVVCQLEAHRCRKSLALYSALGASMLRRWRLLATGLTAAMVSGALLAMMLAWRLRDSSQLPVALSPTGWLAATLAIALLIGVISALIITVLMLKQLSARQIWPELQSAQ